MNSVLKKTVASLETALKYNPDNIELMTSLAEGYIRMGKLDGETIGLCEQVLARRPGNALINQAQAVAFVVEQVDGIHAGLADDRQPPAPEDVQSSLSILEEFMQEVGDSAVVWLAWTRLHILAGNFEEAVKGLRRHLELEPEELPDVAAELDWSATHLPRENIPWRRLHEAYCLIDEREVAVRRLEMNFDQAVAQAEIGPILLEHYKQLYTPSRPDEVPEDRRPRFFQILLDYGDPEATAEWLRKASLFGWEINSYSKVYIKELVEAGELEMAFELLQRMPMDAEVQAYLNRIADLYEDRDGIDEAVRVLRYINDHLLEDGGSVGAEAEMTREMELSLAELNVRNGRLNEALMKYTAALCLSDRPDEAVIERIDEILCHSMDFDPPLLLRLSAYFRRHQDHPKTVYYLNRLLAQDPRNTDALGQLQTLFGEILQENPDNPDLRLELGKLYLKLDRIDEAIRELEVAVSTTRLNDSAGKLLAHAYQCAGARQKALEQYRELMITPHDFEDLYQLHLDFAREEDPRAALMALDLIHRVDSNFRDVASRRNELQMRDTSPPIPAEAPGDRKMRELIGEMAIGRYRHVAKVGSGGMGVVYKVEDIKHNRVVAMKILRDSLGGSSKALDRFFREARIAASIKNRNIVSIYDYNISSINGQSYICMEFVDGPSLRQIIEQHFENTVSISLDYVTEMLYYSVQLLSALEATHEKGIIHRDIKPDNVMIDPQGQVKITDFGIVHVEEATFTPTGAMLGTPRYMSPEQVTGAKLDGRSDIYSVGILLYEILTGSPPFITGDISFQQVNKDPVAPIEINRVIPESVNAFILKCLEKDPDDRYDGATQAREVLMKELTALGGCRKYQNATVVGTGHDGAAPSELLPPGATEVVGPAADFPSAPAADSPRAAAQPSDLEDDLDIPHDLLYPVADSPPQPAADHAPADAPNAQAAPPADAPAASDTQARKIVIEPMNLLSSDDDEPAPPLVPDPDSDLDL